MTGGGDASTVVTHISSLGEDLVLEIFLRLPSLATLVRAALSCRAWRRAVASSPDFRRRFRALVHPVPPLLGVFFNGNDDDPPGPRSCVPSFVPAGFCEWDLAGAVRGGDFFLTSLLERSIKDSFPYLRIPYWRILDCRSGRILLGDISGGDNPFILLNPMMRHSAYEFRYPSLSPDQHATSPQLICLDEDSPSSFRVALLAVSGCTFQPSVFSSDTGEWSDLPAVDFPARVADGDGTSGDASERISIEDQWKLRANRFVYWTYVWSDETGQHVDWRRLISLDITTMEVSFAKLPQCLHSNDFKFTFQAGEAEDGAVCFVYSDGFNIGVVKHTRCDDGTDRWVPDRLLCFDDVIQHPWEENGFDRWVPDDRVFRVELDAWVVFTGDSLSVLAVRDGYVYFETLETLYDPRRQCCIMSLCLATMKVEKLFQWRYDGNVFPYIMPWPPCLLAGNYGQFEFEGAP